MNKTTLTRALRFAIVVAALSFASATFARAQYTAKTIYTFPSYQGESQVPHAIVLDSKGSIYGTITDSACISGCGRVFELSPNSNGTWTDIASLFMGTNTPSGVVRDSVGNVYGASIDGNGTRCNCGSIFEFSPSSNGWYFYGLHIFNFTNGGTPNAPLLAPDGAIYGTTQAGGSSDPNSQGVVYKLSQNSNGGWVETVLHRFTGGNDGGVPMAGLIMDANGVLYGTASQGGLHGYGTVYTLTPNTDGKYTFAWIHAFTGYRAGGNPMSPLLLDAAGDLYGTTSHGGIHGECNSIGCGVVFELVKSATGYTESVLHIAQAEINGESPSALVADSAGNLYSSTSSGNGFPGAVFKLTPTAGGWQETILLTGNSDLGNFGPLTIDSAGNLYGPASNSKIFELSPPSP
jgi:uncharacterized repeat protein (TIGR03803 family)